MYRRMAAEHRTSACLNEGPLPLTSPKLLKRHGINADANRPTYTRT